MLKKKKKEEETNNGESIQVPKSLLIYGTIFLIACIFIFSMGKTSVSDISKVKKEKIHVTNEEIITIFDKIKDNYSLSIDETINSNKTNYLFSTDGNVDLYESDSLEYGYIFYNNNVFYLNPNTMKLKKSKESYNFINNIYYDIDFIKSLINKCDMEYINTTNVNCKLNISDYINSYNSFMNTSINNVEDYIMNINISYSSEIQVLNIDYSKVNKIINNSDDNIEYHIEINNVNRNDHNEIFEHYKEVLEK